MTVPTVLVQFFSNPLMETLFFIPLGLIFFDLLFGIGAAIRCGTFDMKHVSSFLSQDVLRYMGAVSLVMFATVFFGTTQAVALSSLLGMGPLAASLTKSILENIHEVLVGSPLSEALVAQTVEQLGTIASQEVPPPPPSFSLPVPPGGHMTPSPQRRVMISQASITQDEGWLLK